MDTTPEKLYDVAIVGGGITGAALLYVLAKYTNLEKLVLLEKYSELAQVNSHFDSNSQTLHFGDIETNYSLEKALQVKKSSSLMAGFAERFAKDAILLSHKMVLAVGKDEVAELERRYQQFHHDFPGFEKLDRAGIFALEPKVIEGRDPHEKVLALMSRKGYALNYQKISFALAEQALRQNKVVEVLLKKEVLKILPYNQGWKIKTEDGEIIAKTVAVTSGPHSLLFAKSLGYGKTLGILPVAGSFYRAVGLLKGKVYTTQIKKLPFAAIHGDPNVNDPTETRFGPTAKILPFLERHHWNTLGEFLRTSVFTVNGFLSLITIISDKTNLFFMLKNILYDTPLFGKWLFLKEARKIVPTIKWKDLEYGEGLGGIRPQVVDTLAKKMEMGEAKIIGENILFDITPSPGASVSLENARKSALQIGKFLGNNYSFDEERFLKDHEFEY